MVRLNSTLSDSGSRGRVEEVRVRGLEGLVKC